MKNDLSEIIRQGSVLNNPGDAYFNSFLPRYKMYRKAKARRQQILVVASTLTVACLTFVAINNSNELDIPTSAGVEMSNHHTQHGKVVVFEGTVVDVTKFIKEHVKEKTETLCLKEYFRGDDVWGVYVPGDEKFRYYYQGLGKGKYVVFVINEKCLILF